MVINIPVMVPSKGSETSSSQDRSQTVASQFGYNFSSVAAISLKLYIHFKLYIQNVHQVMFFEN